MNRSRLLGGSKLRAPGPRIQWCLCKILPQGPMYSQKFKSMLCISMEGPSRICLRPLKIPMWRVPALGHNGEKCLLRAENSLLSDKGVYWIICNLRYMDLIKSCFVIIKGFKAATVDQSSSVNGYSLIVEAFKKYRQTSNIRLTLVGNEIVDHADVVGASPVGAAPTTSSLTT